MLESCPHCGSTDLITVECGNDDADTLLECESCHEQVRGDEV